MSIDIDESKLKGTEFKLGLAWTAATAVGMLVGYLPLAFLVGSLDLGLVRVIVPIITGALLGLAQYLVLRPYIAKSYDWIINQAVGWVVGFAIGLLVVQFLSRTALGMLLGFVAFGLIVSLFQYPALRREIPHLAPWVIANVVGWTLGAYLSQLAAGAFFQSALPTTFSGVLVSVGITGLVAGAVTAVALVWIVRQPDQLDVQVKGQS